MKIKLTPVSIKKAPKDKYFVEVRIMHGDADHYDNDLYPCEDEAEFKKIMSAFKDMPKPEAEGGGDEYCEWCDNLLGEYFVPHDVSGYDCRATVRSFKGFYYDEHGAKFEAELVN
jgi:hypothetical protein